MIQRIEIYDTTLRDGSQGEGVNFSVSDKCRIAEHLDAFGVDFIEGGWPGSNPRDVAFFERAKKLKLKDSDGVIPVRDELEIDDTDNPLKEAIS